jgi:hypothetical protein
VWTEIESVLVRRQIKPLLAVVPDNQDPVLQVDAPAADFWNRVRAWQEWGWTIALHGFQHRYVTRNAGIAAVRKKSEFAGLSAEEQWEKLRRGVDIFEREGITPRVWIAPGNTFDATTVSLLPEIGIRIICDGYFRFPYVWRLPMNPPVASCPLTLPSPPVGERVAEGRVRGWFRGPKRKTLVRGILSPSDRERGWITWVPQQLFYFRPAPPGVWTVCYHHNQWTASQLQQFRDDLDDYGANLASLDEALKKNAPRERKWSAWLCTHPRLSRFLIRAELKLWEVTRGRRQAASAAEADLTSRVTPHASRCNR